MYRSHPGRLTTPAPIGARVGPWLAEQRDRSPGWAPAVASRRQWPLTRRETEVLAAMATGQTNAAIAETLIISRRAVEKHVNSIFTKLCLAGREKQHPRVQAVLIYLAWANTGDTVSRTGGSSARHSDRKLPAGCRHHFEKSHPDAWAGRQTGAS